MEVVLVRFVGAGMAAALSGLSQSIPRESISEGLALVTELAGEKPPAWIAETLAARDRNRAGITAPASGLYLMQVRYPKSLQIPETAPYRPWAMIAGLTGD